MGAGALAAGAWARVERVSALDLPGGCDALPAFPRGIDVGKQRFETWSGEVQLDEVWTAVVHRPADVVRLVNWGHQHGYAVRARGFMHNWSPLTVTADQGCDSRVLLVDTRALSGMALEAGRPAAVRVGAGTTMEALLAFLHDEGHSLTSVPAVGQITVGGALAIGGHGAATPAVGERPAEGDVFGSVSNLVISLTAVVWDPAAGVYALRTFDRSEPITASLLVHLGRAFLTEVVLRVGPARNLRCRSTFTTTVATLFAPPATAGPESFSRQLERAGRIETIWFPFTDRPWTKVWTVAPSAPLLSRPTVGPYPFPFSDNIPEVASDVADQALSGPGPRSSLGHDLGAPLGELVDQLLAGDGSVTPVLGQAELAVSSVGTKALLAEDLWGPAWHTQLYIRWTTLRFAQVGFVVLLPRPNVQWALSAFVARYTRMVERYRARGLYPINGPIEIRASGLDHPSEVGVRGATAPALSALRPRPDHPDWDTGLWVNLLTFAGTPGSYEFLAELERWVRVAFSGAAAGVRAEWSKGWGYSAAGPWTDPSSLDGGLASTYDAWETARADLASLDPHRVFSNPFLDRLLP